MCVCACVCVLTISEKKSEFSVDYYTIIIPVSLLCERRSNIISYCGRSIKTAGSNHPELTRKPLVIWLSDIAIELFGGGLWLYTPQTDNAHAERVTFRDVQIYALHT